jgi:hypothetical protein
MTPRAIKALVSGATRERLAGRGSLLKKCRLFEAALLAGGCIVAGTAGASRILILTTCIITVGSDLVMSAPASLNFAGRSWPPAC